MCPMCKGKGTNTLNVVDHCIGKKPVRSVMEIPCALCKIRAKRPDAAEAIEGLFKPLPKR